MTLASFLSTKPKEERDTLVKHTDDDDDDDDYSTFSTFFLHTISTLLAIWHTLACHDTPSRVIIGVTP